MPSRGILPCGILILSFNFGNFGDYGILAILPDSRSFAWIRGSARYNVNLTWKLMSFGKAILVVLFFCAFCHAQRFRFSPLPESTILQREQNAPTNQHDREARIKVLFLQAGCANQLGEQQLEKLPGANVICRLPGSSNETIIVGATYSQLAPDNWTGASLLPSLFQTLVRRKRRHTFIFVAFDDSGGDLGGAQVCGSQLAPADD